MTWGKNEDVVDHAEADVHPLEMVSAMAGWAVEVNRRSIADLPPEHLALLGQSASRVPALLIVAKAVDGLEIRQTYTIRDRAALANLIHELIATFLDREMFKQLVALLPDEFTR